MNVATRALVITSVKFLHGDVARLSYLVGEASRLAHPSIVRVVKFGCTAPGELCVVTERVAGATLRTVLRRAPMMPSRALRIAHHVCSALAHAHAHGVVHGDLSADTILVLHDGDDAVRIAGFGFAPAARDDDLHALGSLLFEMLTGGISPDGLALPVASLAPHVPPQLAALVARLLDPDPARRPRSAQELLARLDSIVLAPVIARARKSERRRVRLPAAVLAAVSLAGAALTLRPQAPEVRAPAIALQEREISSAPHVIAVEHVAVPDRPVSVAR